MNVRTVAVIGGTGRLGIGLAKRLAQAGVEVMIGSRDAAKARTAAGSVESGQARGLVNPEAARAAELIIMTVPYAAHRPTLWAIGEETAGKVVVETTVPLVEANPLRLERPQAGSVAEEAQQALPQARIVGAFHTVSAGMLADLSRRLHGDVLVCGDYAEAKDVVAELVRAIGMRPVDVGMLARAHALEELAGLVMTLNRRYKRRDLGITVAGLKV